MSDFEFTTSLDVEHYRRTLTHRLEIESRQRRTARGGLDFQIAPAGDDRHTFTVSYRINRLLGARLEGDITAEGPGSRITGDVRTNAGVYLVCVLLLTSGVITTVLRPAGIVVLLAAVCIIVLITFLILGIRQGLVGLLRESVNARSQIS